MLEHQDKSPFRGANRMDDATGAVGLAESHTYSSLATQPDRAKAKLGIICHRVGCLRTMVQRSGGTERIWNEYHCRKPELNLLPQDLGSMRLRSDGS